MYLFQNHHQPPLSSYPRHDRGFQHVKLSSFRYLAREIPSLLYVLILTLRGWMQPHRGWVILHSGYLHHSIHPTTKNAMLELASIFNRVAPLPAPQPTPSPSIPPRQSKISSRKTVQFQIPSTRTSVAPLRIDPDSPRVDATPPRVGNAPMWVPRPLHSPYHKDINHIPTSPPRMA